MKQCQPSFPPTMNPEIDGAETKNRSSANDDKKDRDESLKGCFRKRLIVQAVNNGGPGMKDSFFGDDTQ